MSADMICPTVVVKADTKKGSRIINASDFDASKHELLEQPVAEAVDDILTTETARIKAMNREAIDAYMAEGGVEFEGTVPETKKHLIDLMTKAAEAAKE